MITVDDFYPKRNQNVSLGKVDGKVFLVHLERALLFHLNDTSSQIWKLCDGCTPIRRIIEIMRGRYKGAPGRTLKKDVVDVVEKFTLDDLITLNINQISTDG